MILIFDATSASSVRVLLVDGEKIVTSEETQKTRSSSSFFLSAFSNLVKEAGITAQQIQGLYVAEGLGSFTTVRVGSVVANTIGFCLDAPVLGSFFKRSLNHADLRAIEKQFEGVRGYSESYAPKYHRAPTITTSKKS